MGYTLKKVSMGLILTDRFKSYLRIVDQEEGLEYMIEVTHGARKLIGEQSEMDVDENVPELQLENDPNIWWVNT